LPPSASTRAPDCFSALVRNGSQCGEQQIVAAGALGHGDLAALEVGQRFDRRFRRHQDRLRGGRGGFLGDVGEFGARGLREKRHRVGDIRAEIDVVGVDRLQQRQAAGKLMPRHAHAERRQRLLQFAIGLQDRRQRRGLLVADADRVRRLRAGERDRQDGGHRRRLQGRDTLEQERGWDGHDELLIS
jgi:hypothetical protein